jgi:ubiquinone/menaquinone biosynthesis C-methylase UbiE
LGSTRRQPVSSERYDDSYFLASCEGYDEFVATEGEHLSRRLREAFEVAEVRSGMRVLDVGCGRGEIVHRCAAMGVDVFGVDYASTAVYMAARHLAQCDDVDCRHAVFLSDAKALPFSSSYFDRVLMFDLVEHLHSWELSMALAEARRVLRPEGRLVVHTAPNAWYDQYAYPMVRAVRILMSQGAAYPKDPRAIIPANLDVHVNEQSVVSLWRVLHDAGFRPKVWLSTPPQNRNEGLVFRVARHILFNWIPFQLFFEREVFAVASVRK